MRARSVSRRTIGTLLVCATLLAVDGDTIKCDGVNMRDMGDGKPFVSGYDAPEISKPKCQEELELGCVLINRGGSANLDSGLSGVSA